MNLKLKPPEDPGKNPSGFRAGMFQEIPTCTNGNCGVVAIEVDYFFPYLDDYNRCQEHRLPAGLTTAPMA